MLAQIDAIVADEYAIRPRNKAIYLIVAASAK
jgi:hypothetical protein